MLALPGISGRTLASQNCTAFFVACSNYTSRGAHAAAPRQLGEWIRCVTSCAKVKQDQDKSMDQSHSNHERHQR